MDSGNGNKINYPLVVAIVVAVVAVSGLVIGQYQSQAASADRFVLKEQYRCDEAQREARMQRIEGKIDKLSDYLMGRKRDNGG